MPDFASTSDQTQSAKVFTSAYGPLSLRNRSIQILIGAILLASAAFAAGVYYQNNQTKANISTQNLQQISPIPIEILTNRGIGEWQASVEGTISNKDDENLSLVVKKDTNTVTVKIVTDLTSISDASTSPAKAIAFTDLKLGDFVRMTVWLPLEGSIPASGTARDIVARYITRH